MWTGLKCESSDVSTQLPTQIVARRAEVALERLQVQDQRRIAFALEKLAAGGMASRDIRKLPGAKGEIYLIRAGRDLRIIIRRTENAVEVLDIVRHDKLQQVYNTFRRGGGAV
jgi:hypothetical protein